MIMALFGAPLEDADHADHAVETALAMSAGLAQLNREWTAAGRPPLDIGIGINTGDMVAGNLGSEDIMSYTVIGDQVNLGARLESLNKDFHTRVIISDATRAALKGRYDIRALGDVVVKGKSDARQDLLGRAAQRPSLEGLNAERPLDRYTREGGLVRHEKFYVHRHDWRRGAGRARARDAGRPAPASARRRRWGRC